MNFRKLLSIILTLSLIGWLIPYKAEAASSDTFQITITVNYLSIALKNQAGTDYTTWAIGQVATSSQNIMDSNSGGAGDDGVQIDNNSNCQIDLYCYATNTANWTLSSSVGIDQCVLKAKGFSSWQASPNPNMTGAVTITSTSSPGNEVDSNIAATTDRYWYFQLDAPSEVTSGSENTFTVTIAAQVG